MIRILLIFMVLSVFSTNALAQDNENFSYVMGNYNFHGSNGHPIDYIKSFLWFSIAAEKGNPKSMYALAKSYRYGRGVFVNIFDAVKWYNMSAEAGYEPAIRCVQANYKSCDEIEKL